MPTEPKTKELVGRGLSKQFGDTYANKDVDITIRGGEIHALLGENGAGKSTLVSILSGLYQPDAGSIALNGVTQDFKTPRDALAQRIGVVHQHLQLVERFTVGENILLGDSRTPAVISRGVHEELRTLGASYHLEVEPRAPISDLSLGQRQRVELLKLLSRDVDILFFDEPTAVLTPSEVEPLFATLRALAANGKAVVIVTHKLTEVFSVADRATVMRNGQVVSTGPLEGTNPKDLAQAMIGREVDLSPKRAKHALGPPALQVRKLSASDDRGLSLTNISFNVHGGEIVAIAGVSGNGQILLAETLAGMCRPEAGQVFIDGKETSNGGVRKVRRAGLAYVPEDRLGTGLAPSLSLAENMQLTQRSGRYSANSGTRAAARAIEEFEVKAPGPHTPVSALSGGNIQKILLSRELSEQSAVLIAASPTRGLDLAAIEFVRGQLDLRRQEGAAILLISEELDEIRALADRTFVMYEGRLVLERTWEEWDAVELGMAMTGALAEEPAC